MGSLRIIAGALRRRKIEVPEGFGVRPTPDRVREALFNILAPWIEGVRVLDAFAGTGAIGLEAVSRGAAEVVFAESDPRVIEVLRANIAALGVAERCRLVVGPVEGLLQRGAIAGPFDLVIADPPYGQDLADAFLGALARAGVLRGGGRVVMERERGAPRSAGPPPLSWIRTERYGRVCLDFYVRPAAG